MSPRLRKTLPALLLIPPLLMLAGILAFLTVNAPYLEDTQVVLGQVALSFPGNVDHLFDFNNEHRLVAVRLAVELLYAVFRRIDLRVCCAFGALFLALWTFGLGRFFYRQGERGRWLFVPCCWMAFSFINYENTCWAVGGLSNYQGFFWGLAANVLLARERRAAAFAGAVLCGIFASLSNGGGLGIWPCLLLQLAFQRRGKDFCRSLLPRFLPLAAVAAVTIALYLRNFPFHGNAPLAALSLGARLLNSALFFVAFLGAWIPFYAPAVLVGCLTLALIVFLALRLPKLRFPTVFFHLVFLLGFAASAALFRADTPHAALCTRYTIFPIAIFVCTVCLAGDVLLPRIPGKVVAALTVLFHAGALFYALGFLALGAPLYAERNEIMRRNVLLWPESARGIRCFESQIERYDGIFRECARQGIWNPADNLRAGEKRPAELTPWPQYKR